MAPFQHTVRGVRRHEADGSAATGLKRGAHVLGDEPDGLVPGYALPLAGPALGAIDALHGILHAIGVVLALRLGLPLHAQTAPALIPVRVIHGLHLHHFAIAHRHFLVALAAAVATAAAVERLLDCRRLGMSRLRPQPRQRGACAAQRRHTDCRAGGLQETAPGKLRGCLMRLYCQSGSLPLVSPPSLGGAPSEGAGIRLEVLSDSVFAIPASHFFANQSGALRLNQSGALRLRGFALVNHGLQKAKAPQAPSAKQLISDFPLAGGLFSSHGRPMLPPTYGKQHSKLIRNNQ